VIFAIDNERGNQEYDFIFIWTEPLRRLIGCLFINNVQTSVNVLISRVKRCCWMDFERFDYDGDFPNQRVALGSPVLPLTYCPHHGTHILCIYLINSTRKYVDYFLSLYLLLRLIIKLLNKRVKRSGMPDLLKPRLGFSVRLLTVTWPGSCGWTQCRRQAAGREIGLGGRGRSTIDPVSFGKD